MNKFERPGMPKKSNPREIKQNVEFKPGDMVRLTPEKIRQLEKGGFMAGFPTTEGEVSTVSGKMMSVQFGHAVRMVEASDVEKIEQ